MKEGDEFQKLVKPAKGLPVGNSERGSKCRLGLEGDYLSKWITTVLIN